MQLMRLNLSKVFYLFKRQNNLVIGQSNDPCNLCIQFTVKINGKVQNFTIAKKDIDIIFEGTLSECISKKETFLIFS